MKLLVFILLCVGVFATVPDYNWTGTLKECANLELENDLEHNLTKEELETITEFECSYGGEILFDPIRDLKNVEVLKMRGNRIFQYSEYILDVNESNETNESVTIKVDAYLPSWIGELSSLRELDLSGNGMQGYIPDEIGTLINLEKLDLSVNRFTKIPSSIGDLNASLKELHLASCGLVQLLPKELGNLSSLTHLYLQDNRLHGGIPIEFGNLLSLKKLRLNQNNLHGTIPVELVDLNLSQPNGLGLHENCNLSRNFPDCNVSDVNDTADCEMLAESNTVLEWIESKASLYRGYDGMRETGGHCGTPGAMVPIIWYLLSENNDTNAT